MIFKIIKKWFTKKPVLKDKNVKCPWKSTVIPWGNGSLRLYGENTPKGSVVYAYCSADGAILPYVEEHMESYLNNLSDLVFEDDNYPLYVNFGDQ